MTEITLCYGDVALIDDCDYGRIAPFRWEYYEPTPGKPGYARRRVKRKGVTRYFLMHREIIGAQPGQFVDHRNLNKLDNRRENLRIATRSQNRTNTPARRDGFKGVYPSGKRWCAKINDGGKSHHLGSFDTEAEAAQAYDRAARERFGDFARCNFEVTA